MGQLDHPYRGRRSSSTVIFDHSKLVVITGKSFGGFAGVADIRVVDPAIPDLEMGGLIREAWDAREKVSEYDEVAIDQSWEPVAEMFGVDRYSMARIVGVNRLDEIVNVVPSEWKGDNRVNLSSEVINLPLDVSDKKLGAAVRRAMELTVS